MSKPDEAPPNPAASVSIDDRPVMLLGIFGFGLTIPWVAGLYGALRPDDARFWIGCVGFIGLAAAIWLGNRWLLFKQRQHFGWFDHPVRKLMLLVTANLLYTAPLSALAIALWQRVAGQAPDRAAIEVVVLINVICVLFVTHAYETVFLIRERESDLTRVERLERLRSQAGATVREDPYATSGPLQPGSPARNGTCRPHRREQGVECRAWPPHGHEKWRLNHLSSSRPANSG